MVDLSLVNEALLTTQEDEPFIFQREYDMRPCALFRSNFLLLCQNPDMYEVVRNFPFSEQYDRLEEKHFRDICDVIQTWNEVRQSTRVQLRDCQVPPVRILRRLWAQSMFFIHF